MADNGIESIYKLDVTSVLAELDKIDQRFEGHEEKLRSMAKVDPFKEAAQGAGKLEAELAAGTKQMAEMQATIAAYKEEVKKLIAEEERLKKALNDVNAAGKHDGLQKELAGVQEKIQEVNASLGETTTKTGGLRGMISSVTGKFKELTAGATQSGTVMNKVMTAGTRLAGLMAIAVAASAVAIYNARQRYMEYNDALLAVTGNQKDVTNNMDVLDGIATDLNTSLSNVTSAFGVFTSQGLKPTKSELKNIGTLAKETKTNITELSAAIVSADGGQVDALKKLGIQAQVQGNKVKLSFRGVTSEFVKGSGDSVKAIDEIVKKIELTENSAAKIGRADFMDRLAKGFVDAEMAINEASETSSTKAYPAFDRLFKLLDKGKGYVLDMAESFGIWVGIGWEHIKNDAMVLVAALAYLPDALKNGLTQANNNFTTAKNAFLANRKAILEEEARLQAGVGKSDGELTSNGTKLKPEDKEAIAAAKARKKELERLEKELQDALTKLRSQYGKDQLEALKGDHLKYIEEKRKLNQQEIDLEEKALLKLKQLAVGARRGRFDKDGKAVADTSVNLSQDERAPLDFRRGLVNDQAYLEQAKFINDNEKKITELLSNEYQKQLQATEYKYEELFKLARESGIDIANLERAKAKELARINSDKAIADLEKQAIQEQGDAELNIIQAQIDGRIDLELQARKGLFEIEKKFLLQKIKLIEESGDAEADARIRSLKKTVADIDLAINELSKEEKKEKGITKFLNEVLGMSKDDIKEAYDSAALFVGSMRSIMSDLYSTLDRLSQGRIRRIDEEINKKKEQVETEMDLNRQGLANNLDLRNAEMQKLKEARERALADQKRIQKQQLIADTITQTSSMITAASKVYAGFAGIPIVGVGLGVAAVALMLGAFAAAKIKSFQLAREASPEQYGEGGKIDHGNLHKDGGTLIEAEKGEFVVRRSSTEKYGSLIDAINQDNPARIMDYLLTDLLNGTNVTRADQERKENQAFIREYQAESIKTGDDHLNALKQIESRLLDIEKGTNRIPKVQYVSIDGKLVEIRDSSVVVRELPS